MEDTSENRFGQKKSKHVSIGLLAHVDAGKTTLSEAILYESGSIRKMGRVDKKDAFLDTDELERERGITIFSKQAVFLLGEAEVTLLDTPGHVDFSGEMERTLQVLDCAILVISAADGVQGHTQTLWRLLKRYKVPTFLFINKMDQEGTDAGMLLNELKKKLNDGCINFKEEQSPDFYEAAALTDEEALDSFLENGTIQKEILCRLIRDRKVFPCFFGSALKLEGIREFLDGLLRYLPSPDYPDAFGAKVFKITRDEQGSRLTHMKITGGSLKVKDSLEEGKEKVNQIRIYSGEKYQTKTQISAGTICAVTGLSDTRAGEGYGIEEHSLQPVLEPVMTYRMMLMDDCDPASVLPKLWQLEEEEPELHIVWNEELQEIQIQMMGEVQTEIIKRLLLERFGIEAAFDTGSIVYKETIADTVEGVGHFEPLRHYAEVHLLMEPGEPGSGLQFASKCSEDRLEKNWQRLILTHLEEKRHPGVLTGAPVTDIKFTLMDGRAHKKHTEGGDFRQATYRAVRQGLKKAESVLLEPYYEFRMEIPEDSAGRAMTDIDRMQGRFGVPVLENGICILTGSAPAAKMQGYSRELLAYTRGYGRIFYSLKGYEPCHNTQEILTDKGYDSERDTENPSGSVFCSHGAGFLVPWNKVEEYMHLESCLPQKKQGPDAAIIPMESSASEKDEWIGTDEIDRILERTFYANKRDKAEYMRSRTVKKELAGVSYSAKPGLPAKKLEEYLLVDGYNMIFAWEELKTLAAENIDGARGKLMDLLCNYQGIRNCSLIVVFDAYRVQNHEVEIQDYHNIHVVFTREAETADQYIEKFAHEHKKKYDVTVATSDAMEQIITRGQGCRLLSARELREEMLRTGAELMEEFGRKNSTGRSRLLDHLSEDAVKQMAALRLDLDSNCNRKGTEK